MIKGLSTLALLGLMTALPQTAVAEMKIYPYPSSENYCPAGLQPVTISGVICCGTPNVHTTYQQVMAHPVAKKKHHVKRRYVHRTRAHCPVGTKGCTFD
ncbi:hypothetical protein [uncultured Sulfitobacter sp.]|uniref:hypothetical protein n=1 Tax=uncultured Sulfitobacter sp. TaxID=191468 RepID=UPI0026303CC6|nr:hypothetical protein [uncultured Sulfitobacter sp.]